MAARPFEVNPHSVTPQHGELLDERRSSVGKKHPKLTNLQSNFPSIPWIGLLDITTILDIGRGEVARIPGISLEMGSGEHQIAFSGQDKVDISDRDLCASSLACVA